MLDRTREDLGDVINTISMEKLKKSIPGEVQGSIMGIIEHIAWSEWWYLDRIGLAFDRNSMPSDPLMMVRAIRQHTKEILEALIEVERITPSRGEYWSPRKVLRRTIWHERDHTNHIAKLRTYI